MRRNGALPHVLVFNSRIPRALNSHGFTLACWTFLAHGECSAELRCHEYRHVQHGFATLFVGFWLLYLVEYGVRIVGELLRGNVRSTLKAAYRRIWWERDAYAWARRNMDRFDPARK